MSDDNPYASPKPTAADAPAPARLLEIQIDPALALVVEGTLSADDFFAAQKLHRASHRAVSWLVLALLVLAAGGGMKLFFGGQLGWGGFVVIGILFYLLVAALIFPRLGARTTWKNSPALREPMKRLITPDVMQTITPTSNVILRWSLFAHFRRSDELVLLYLSEFPGRFLVLPRHMFRSDDDWRRFVAIVEQQLPAG